MTAMSQDVTLTTQVRHSAKVLTQEVGGEVVLLDLDSELYFGLDPVGSRIWALLADTRSLEHVHATLCREFDGDTARIKDDLLALIQQLAEAGLVELG